MTDKDTKAQNSCTETEKGEIVLDGLNRKYDFVDDADKTIVNKASILITIELTASIAYLGAIKETLKIESPNFFYLALGMVFMFSSVIILITTIIPRQYKMPFPEIDKEDGIMNKPINEFYEFINKRITNAINTNAENQAYKTKMYRYGIITFLISIFILISMNVQNVIYGNANQPVNNDVQTENEMLFKENRQLNLTFSASQSGTFTLE